MWDQQPCVTSTCSQTNPPLQQPGCCCTKGLERSHFGSVSAGQRALYPLYLLYKPCKVSFEWRVAITIGCRLSLRTAACLELTCTPPLFFSPWGIKSLVSCLLQAAEGLWSTWLCGPRIFLPKRESSLSLPSFLKCCLGFIVLIFKKDLSNTAPVSPARQQRFCALQTRERHSCSVFCLFCLDNFLLPVIRLLLGLFSRGGTLVSLSLFHRHTLRDFPMVVCGNNESPVHGNAHEIVLVTHN